MFDEIFPDSRASALSQQVQRPYQPPEPGTWQGFGTALADSLPYAGQTVGSAWAAIFDAYGNAAAYRDANTVAMMHGKPVASDDEIRHQTIDKMFDSELAREFRERAKEYAPDPTAVGTAGRVVHGLLANTAKMTAYAGTGPAAPALFGIDAGINRSQELTDQGVDGATALQAGAVTGVVSAAMMKIPPSLGATRLQSAGIGAVVAPTLNVAEVGGIRLLLEHANYDKIAAQYQPFDPLNLSIAALTGGAFGGLFHTGGKSAAAEAPRLTPEEHAAALVMNEVRTRDADALVRTDNLAAASRAAEAQALARQQMDAGEMVSVAHMVEPDPPTLEAARAMAMERMTSELRAELIPEAANRAEPGAVAQMTQERTSIEQRLEMLRSEAGFREEAKLQQEQGLSRKEAESAARKALPERIAALEEQAARLDRLLEANQRAAKAEQDLALLERGQIPERYLSSLEGRTTDIVRGFQPRPIAQGVRSAFEGGARPADLPASHGVSEAGVDAPASIVERVRDAIAQAFGHGERAPKQEPTALTPEQTRAQDIAARNPDALIRLEDGSEVRMADLISHTEALEARAKTDAKAFEVAVACALRFPL